MKALLVTTLSLAFAAAPAFASNVMYKTHFKMVSPALRLLNTPTTATDPLKYYGGPVISNAKVFVVLWGNNVDGPTASGMGDFFSALTKSDIMDWMDQYNTTGKSLDGRDGTNQHIGKGSFAGVIKISPAKTSGDIDDKEIQAELQKQIDAGVLPKPDDNTLYMTYFPPGMTIGIDNMHSCSEFCAYHGFNGSPQSAHFYYGVMPDLGGACSFGCGFNQHMDNVTSISTHEFCEAVTDPYPTPGNTAAYPQAWNDSQASEIGDKCADSLNTLKQGSRTWTVQSEFDNAAGGCTSRTWTAQ